MKLFRLGLAGVCAVVLLTGCPWTQDNPRFLNAYPSQWSYFGNWLDDAAAGGTETTTDDTSSTDTETREVVEPDVIRRAGNVLYILNQYRGLTLVDLDTQAIIGCVPTLGYPRDLYVVDDRAYVIVGYATDYTTEGQSVSYTVASRLYVVDISNPAQSTISGQFDLTGDLVDSRLVGDVLYAICAEYTYSWDDVVSTVAKTDTSASWVTSVNVSDPANPQRVADVSFDGLGSVIQATNSAIFVAAPDWYTDQTAITYVDISDPAGAIRVAGQIAVDGTVEDKYNMDAYQGVLRVVSNEWQWENAGRLNYVTTIDLSDPDHLAILGQTQLQDANGESLFATRFDGTRAYVVTYLAKDPLFVVDLSDPANPVVTGSLEVPGWSTYIEPQGDRLIALGVDDSTGQQRVCVTLYDVSDPAHPAQVGDRVSFGEGWVWSSAYTDVKAFTVLDDVLLVPFTGWIDSGGSYERLQFISYSAAGLTARGYVDVQGSVQRSFAYNDSYYGVTTEQLATIDASDLSAPLVTHRLTLAEYIADVLELTPALTAEVISEYESGQTLVRAVDAEAGTTGSIEAAAGTLDKVLPYGTSVVLVGTEYDDATYESHYHVVVVDCSTAAAPVIASDLVLDVTPYWSYWYYPYYLFEDMAASWLWYDCGTWSESVFLSGNTLVLRCSADAFDDTVGSETASQGLAFVDVATGTPAGTLGLGYSDIEDMHLVGGTLYINTQVFEGYRWFRGMCANYIQAFDVAARTMGPSVNVPGTFVQYDAAKGLLLVRNKQWDDLATTSETLQTVQWHGGSEVEPLQSIDLASGTSTVLGRGELVFADAYSDGSRLSAIRVGSDGSLTDSGTVTVSAQWGRLLDAHDAKAYMTLGNAIVIYDFTGAPALQGVYTFMGSPESIRFGTTSAYVALGYSGIGELPL